MSNSLETQLRLASRLEFSFG